MQENKIIYVTPKAYRLLYNYCANALLDGESLELGEGYRLLEAEGEALEEGWQERRVELAAALAETGVSIKIIEPIINSTHDFVAEHVHSLLRYVRVVDSVDTMSGDRVYISDKAYQKMIEFIAVRHFYYVTDNIDDEIAFSDYVEPFIEPTLKKTESKLRTAFEKSGANYEEFHSMFYNGDLDENNREFNIRMILRKYYPESMRELLDD